MEEYSIRQIESITGIKAHTIRAWEQRYNFFKSKRNSSNIRSFSAQDLQKILKICFLNQQGYRLCVLDNMPQEKINQLVDRQVFEEDPFPIVQQLLLHTINLKIDALEEIISAQIKKMGFHTFLSEILWPFMAKLSLLRHTQVVTARHHHLISELLQRKLYRYIDEAAEKSQNNGAEVLLMDLSAGTEKLPLLGLHYLLQLEGYQVWNLGKELPLDEVNCLSHSLQPPLIFIYHGIHKKLSSKSVKYLQTIHENFPQANVYLAGNCQELPAELAHTDMKTFECLKTLPKLPPSQQNLA